MNLIHVDCLGPIVMKRRMIVSQPEDREWPSDFVAALPYCEKCGEYPSPDHIKQQMKKEKHGA